MIVSSRRERLAFTVLCVATSAMVVHGALSNRNTEEPVATQIKTAYLDGRTVAFELAPVPQGAPTRQVGPWQFGERVLYPTPKDRRQNLYVMSPGSEHHVPGYEGYDHNAIVNHMPPGGTALEWDVYWAVVLDPSLQREFRSEDELLMATQREFYPGDDFRFEQIPGAVFLRDIVKIDSLEILEKYRRPSGNLPQVLILPAGFAVRASVRPVDPESQDAQR